MFFEIGLGIFLFSFYLLSGLIAGFDYFARAVYATLFPAILYSAWKQETSVCSFVFECLNPSKALLVDVTFWFLVGFIILNTICLSLERLKEASAE